MSMGMGIDAAELYGQHRRENWKLRGRETTERQAPDLTVRAACLDDGSSRCGIAREGLAPCNNE
jgi:hypothetical protein